MREHAAGATPSPVPSRPATLLARRVSRPVLALVGPAEGARPGTLHSVFAQAVNIQLTGGAFVSLTAAELPLAANGVAVALPAAWTWPALGLRAGQPCLLDREGLWLPLGPLRVDWGAAPDWEPRPALRPGVTPARLAARLARLQGIALRAADRGGLAPLLGHLAMDIAPAPDSPLARAALPALHALSAAASAADVAGAAVAAARLAGLGPGLTPAGDDLLAGFAATWLLTARALGRDVWRARRLVAAVAGAAGPRASALGAAWLAHAARGEVSEPQGALLTVLLARGETPRDAYGLEAAARVVLAQGATSGADWLAGAVLAGQATLEPLAEGMHRPP